MARTKQTARKPAPQEEPRQPIPNERTRAANGGGSRTGGVPKKVQQKVTKNKTRYEGECFSNWY